MSEMPGPWGRILRFLRWNHHYTLVHVSEEVKIAVSFLSDIETGKATPSLRTLTKLAQYYGVPLVELVDENYCAEDAKLGRAVREMAMDEWAQLYYERKHDRETHGYRHSWMYQWGMGSEHGQHAGATGERTGATPEKVLGL